MAASISATVTQSVSMAGATFSSATTAISGETANIIDTTLASVGTGGADTGTGVGMSGVGFAEAKLQLLYMLSDEADVDMIFTDGTNTVTLRCLQGVPQIYNIAGGIENPFATLTALTAGKNTVTLTVTNNGSQGVSTDIHIRMVFST